MNILMIGDVLGRPGRWALNTILPGMRSEYQLDLVIANAENAAGGLGVTLDTAQELLKAGIDVLTSGNHVWDKKEIIPHLDTDLPLLRPLNYPPGVPGRGYLTADRVLVVNLTGRVFMGNFDCPFRAMDHLLGSQGTRPPVIIVDFHAEATSEKGAMGWYLDGRVSAVIGTHTHIATADTRLLPRGTAYATDVGMTGPLDSVIGDNPEDVLQRFLTAMPFRLSVGTGKVIFNGILLDVDEVTGRARSITRLSREVDGEPDEG